PVGAGARVGGTRTRNDAVLGSTARAEPLGALHRLAAASCARCRRAHQADRAALGRRLLNRRCPRHHALAATPKLAYPRTTSRLGMAGHLALPGTCTAAPGFSAAPGRGRRCLGAARAPARLSARARG